MSKVLTRGRRQSRAVVTEIFAGRAEISRNCARTRAKAAAHRTVAEGEQEADLVAFLEAL